MIRTFSRKILGTPRVSSEMRPEIRFTPPRRARRRIAGFVIPEYPKVSKAYKSQRNTTAHPGCYHEESCGGAWLRPFRVPFLLFRVQTCYKICSGGWVVVVLCAKSRMKAATALPAGYITMHGVAVLYFPFVESTAARMSRGRRARVYI